MDVKFEQVKQFKCDLILAQRFLSEPKVYFTPRDMDRK